MSNSPVEAVQQEVPVKFRKHFISKGNIRVPVYYYILNDHNRVCISAKKYSGDLSEIFSRSAVVNNSNPMVDYFERDEVHIDRLNPYFEAAYIAAVSI